MDWLAIPLGYVMKGCMWLVSDNYVLALLLFALAMQILLSPFGIKQQKNLIKQAYLRPKEMAIRKKYAGRNDRTTMQKVQNEIMQLQQEAGYSPLAGCLPMLLQLILIFPIYSVAIRPLEFVVGISQKTCAALAAFVEKELSIPMVGSSSYQIKLAGWLNNPDNLAKLPKEYTIEIEEGVFEAVPIAEEFAGHSSFPSVSMFGQDLSIDPWDAFGESFWWLVFIPILNLALMYVSQYLSKKLQYQSTLQEQANGQMSSMKIMMLAMPLMTMFITFNFAAVIGIYWIFRTILSMLQQFILYKAMPYPKFTEEDYKNAEKELKGKRVSSAPANYVHGEREIRSLHHIDDDE